MADLTVNLSDGSASTAVGNLTPTARATLSGASATTTVGSVTASEAVVNLSGTSVSTALGSFTFILTANLSLTGVSGSSRAGHLLRRLAGLTNKTSIPDSYEYSGITVAHGLTQGIGLTSK